MRINFVTIANDNVASYRYHAVIPARELERLGHKVTIGVEPDYDAEVMVFSKHWNYADHQYIKAARLLGKTTVFHVCDDHFQTQFREHYIRMIDVADVVIASTEIMAERIKHECDREAEVIFDAYEYGLKEPEYMKREKPHVLWFGHPSNLDTLKPLMPIEGIDLRICTTEGKIPVELANILFMPWSKENLKVAFEWCDVVIIPTSTELRKLVKSHNRMTEAIRNGKFVIANDHPSYRVYESMYLGDVKEGLYWLKSQTEGEIKDRIAKAQKVTENFNPEKIGEQWEKALLRKNAFAST